ncbi:MAG: tetratricopeptide repeat protein [Chthoniobacterales bacterium]|nr:tetratricopeptide repeat protein [Chthoniobacterales bacterium]
MEQIKQLGSLLQDFLGWVRAWPRQALQRLAGLIPSGSMQKKLVARGLPDSYGPGMKTWFLLLFLVVGSAFQLQARDTYLPVGNLPGAVAACNQAYKQIKKGDFDGAIQSYTTAFKVDPRMYVAIYERGVIYMHQHKWELAIADFNTALKVSPSFFLAAIKRAEVNQTLGRYDQALAELTHIINLRPRYHTDALARSDRAWLYATCPDPAFRNGQQAVADATAACKIDSWDNWDYIDTLAAAYAETGDFKNAIKFEEKAIRKGGREDTKSAQERLALYQQQRPFRLARVR